MSGVTRSDVIYSLWRKWKLIRAKVTGENVIVWTEDSDDGDNDGDIDDISDANNEGENGGEKIDVIAKTVARIRHSRAQMESNRNGIVIDDIHFNDTFSNGSESRGCCRLGVMATQQVTIRNESDIDVICDIKSEAARQRNFQIEGEMVFDLLAGQTTCIDVSFTPKRIGITKTIIIFNFDPICDEDNDIDPFSIVRYISIRAGDPDDFDMLKPTTPYVKKWNKREDVTEKFANPVRVKSNNSGQLTSSFEIPLASHVIPKHVEQLAGVNNAQHEAMQVLDSVYRGKENGTYFDKEEKLDYTKTLDIDNYAKCMQHLLWFEETQMKGMIANIIYLTLFVVFVQNYYS